MSVTTSGDQWKPNGKRYSTTGGTGAGTLVQDVWCEKRCVRGLVIKLGSRSKSSHCSANKGSLLIRTLR
jgi:hypothetical protein